MLDYIVYNFPYIALIAIGLFVVAKIVLFLSFRTKNWNLLHLIYFPFQNIKLTNNVKRQRIKKLQNNLTITIVIVTIFYLLYRYFIFPQ